MQVAGWGNNLVVSKVRKVANRAPRASQVRRARANPDKRDRASKAKVNRDRAKQVSRVRQVVSQARDRAVVSRVDRQAGNKAAWARAAWRAGAGIRNGGEPLTEDEIRQLRREFRERAADAQALRGMLNEMGEDTGDLDELLRGLRQMDSERVYMDVQEIQRLQAALLEVAKRFEFSFRRRVEGEDDELLLRGSDEVPPGFEEMIEEYYRALARGRGGS